jgi:hypothetical protein
MADAATPREFLSLTEALSRLPLEAPERSAWPMLTSRLQTRQRRPRWPFAAAAAAALLALAFVPRHASVVPITTTTMPATTITNAHLPALMDESARLERLLGAARDDGASSASAAAMSLILEDRLSALDAQLQSQAIAPARQLALWQQRIVLLREAASLEASRQYLAANGQNLDVALVATY